MHYVTKRKHSENIESNTSEGQPWCNEEPHMFYNNNNTIDISEISNHKLYKLKKVIFMVIQEH